MCSSRLKESEAVLQAGLQRERRAFEFLIHAKGHMVIPAFTDLGQVPPAKSDMPAWSYSTGLSAAGLLASLRQHHLDETIQLCICNPSFF